MSWPQHPIGYCHSSCLPVPRLEGSISRSLCEWCRDVCLADIIITSWPDDIKEVPHPLCPYWQHHETLTIKDGLVLHGEALIVLPSERKRILHQLHQFHQGITKSQLLAGGCIFWPGINKAIEEVVHQCEKCTQFQAQNAAAPLTATPTPSHSWQMCTSDIFTLEGANYLICDDFYSKMILIHCLPSGQSNTIKVISLLREMFSEHKIPEILLHSDNGPQYASAQFANFCTSWVITHETLSPHYPQSNGFAEECVKSVKHALQHAKYSGANPLLTLLALQATLINAKLPSPADLLYQCQLRTTIPAKIHNTDPAALQVHKRIATCSDTFRTQADKHCKSLAPLYAGQPVAMYDTLCKIWVPTTVVHVLPKDNYQVYTSNGTVYHCTRWHLHEHSVKPADTVPDATTTTLQAPDRPCIFVSQPTPTNPVQPAQPTLVAPATPVTPKPQTTAVFTTPAAPKVALCAYTCDTQCSPHAAQKIRSCSCHTQVPDTRNVTILLPMRGEHWCGMSLDFIT